MSSSWGQWLSTTTYSAGESVSAMASTVSESSTFQQAAPLLAQLRDGAVAVATKVGEGAVAAAAVVEETTESALASASVIAERRILTTNISLLESDIASAKREWGVQSWDAMAEGDLDTVRANFHRAKTLVAEIEQQIIAKRLQIDELDAEPEVVETPSGVHVAPPQSADEVEAAAAGEAEATPRARGLQMPQEEETQALHNEAQPPVAIEEAPPTLPPPSPQAAEPQPTAEPLPSEPAAETKGKKKKKKSAPPVPAQPPSGSADDDLDKELEEALAN